MSEEIISYEEFTEIVKKECEYEFAGFSDKNRPIVIQEAIDDNQNVISRWYEDYQERGETPEIFAYQAAYVLRLCW